MVRLSATKGTTQMSRLIKRYRKMPSPTNRKALGAWIAKHGAQSATPEETAFLKANSFL